MAVGQVLDPGLNAQFEEPGRDPVDRCSDPPRPVALQPDGDHGDPGHDVDGCGAAGGGDGQRGGA
jgi:hypothetical protein